MRWKKKEKMHRIFKTGKVWTPRECIVCKETCWLEIMRTSFIYSFISDKEFRLDICMACGFDPDKTTKIFENYKYES